MCIGDKISDLRKQAKMTQKDLAEMMNVSDKVISKWETGKSLPDVESMLRLSKVFSVPISELYDLVEKTNTKNTEEYNEERLWQYKKYTIISCFLLVLSPALYFMSALPWSYFDDVQHIFTFVLILLSIAALVFGLIFEITQFVRLYSYSRTKFYRSEYNKALIKYGIIFLGALHFPINFVLFLVGGYIVLNLN